MTAQSAQRRAVLQWLVAARLIAPPAGPGRTTSGAAPPWWCFHPTRAARARPGVAYGAETRADR